MTDLQLTIASGTINSGHTISQLLRYAESKGVDGVNQPGYIQIISTLDDHSFVPPAALIVLPMADTALLLKMKNLLLIPEAEVTFPDFFYAGENRLTKPLQSTLSGDTSCNESPVALKSRSNSSRLDLRKIVAPLKMDLRMSAGSCHSMALRWLYRATTESAPKYPAPLYSSAVSERRNTFVMLRNAASKIQKTFKLLRELRIQLKQNNQQQKTLQREP